MKFWAAFLFVLLSFNAWTAEPSVEAPNEQSPLTIPLTLEIRPVVEQQAANQKEHREARPQPEEDLVIWTKWLVWVGAGVGVITAAVLAYQALLTNAQVRLAREEFVSANRPVLELRRERLLQSNGQWGINLVIANTGNLKATKIVGNFTTRVLTQAEKDAVERESLPPYSAATQVDIGQMLNKPPRKHGDLEAMQRAFIFFVAPELSDSSLSSIRKAEKFLCHWGYINFNDPLGKTWETAFFRTYSPTSESFYPKDDPDYEHT